MTQNRQPDAQVQHPKFDLNIASFCLLLVTLSSAASILILSTRSEIEPLLLKRLDVMLAFAVASLVILIGMCGLYIHAYRFYRDFFFAFLALGWFANAVYILLEAVLRPEPGAFHHSSSIFIFSLISFLPFYFAIHTAPGGKVRLWAASRGLLLWTAIVAGTMVVGSIAHERLWKGCAPANHFFVYALGGVLFSTWTLFRLSRAAAGRMTADSGSVLAKAFPWTFFLFGTLQPIYLVRFYPESGWLVRFAFVAALLAKILNSISALSMIQQGVAALQNRLDQRSALEDLGALTAGVEHEVRSPLVVIYGLLRKLKSRFQASPDILNLLNDVEYQANRITAATEVIPVFRGQKAIRLSEKTSVGDLINRSVKAVKEEFHIADDIHFVSELEVLYTKSYRPMLQQAFVNVLKNAVEAIRDGRRANGVIRISVHKSQEFPDKIEAVFEDNGCGILPGNLPKLTKELYSTKADKKDNSGIGLFVTRRVLNLHNGDIRISSIRDESTTVRILLPLWKES
jgi:signal transduction histidine kinase